MLLGLDKIAASLKEGSEFESQLVSIVCGANPEILRLEVRVWDTDTGGFTSVQLYEIGSDTADPTDYSGCTKTYVHGDATEATLDKVKKALTSATASSRMMRPSAVTTPGTNNIIIDSVKSISFYNAHATVNAQIDAGTSGNVVLKPGETINFDAGGNANKFPAGEFEYDPDPTTNAGDLLIIYVV